jgi:3-(methylthio)propionyl---CoA ligase
MLGLMMNQPLLISGQIEFAAKFHANTEVVTRAVEGPIRRSTYGQVSRRAKKLANALHRAGVGPGDRVATIAWNTDRHLELYFAVSGMGAVLHTINPRLSPDQLKYVVDHSEDIALFFDTTFTKCAQFLSRQSAGIRRFVAMTDDEHLPADHGIAGLNAYESLIAGESDVYLWPELDENTASSLCYTSGTTGNPKGVLYSHRSTVLHSYAAAMADVLGLSSADVTLPVVPMFHVNAWGVPYAAVMVGSKLVLPGPGLDGRSLLDLIEAESVTSLLGVPTVWLALLAQAKKDNKRLSSVKKVTIGGAACPPSMIRAFEEDHGVRVIHAWGMTETSPLGTANVLLPKHDRLSSEDQLAIKVKQGRAVFGVDLRLVDDAGDVLPHDGKTSGHLQIRGPWVASAYFKRDRDDNFDDGWFFTGDIATIDADGYMHVTDRSKDVVKSGGEWISTIEIENAAMSHPAVAQAAVIGVPHPKWQERPLLLIVKAEGQEVASKEILAFLAGRIPTWWVPDAVEVIEALPIGPTGKVLKRALRERFGNYRLQEP